VTANRHPIGFTKINLGTVRGYRARLHVWHGPRSEHPHNHRWAFLAIPLLGRFTDTRWAETVGGTHELVEAFPSTAVGGRRYRPAGTEVGLRKVSVNTRWPLVPYLCRIGEIHTHTPVGDGWHVSLVVLAPPQSDSSTVFQAGGEL
jgi:hypothetical protein